MDVIIPFSGSAAFLAPCLRALAVDPVCAGVLLVDDASEPQQADAARHAVRVLGIPARWLRFERRSGFLRAVNAAWSCCDAPVALILNSDTIPTRDALARAYEALQKDSSLAAAAPASDNTVDLYQYRANQARRGNKPPAGVTLVPYLTASCVALRRAAVAGPLFDPIFSPGYFEDLDLSCRLRAEGWRLAVVETPPMHHTGRATYGAHPDLQAILARNYATFCARWSQLPDHIELTRRLAVAGGGAAL